jgi:TolA-binding protein
MIKKTGAVAGAIAPALLLTLVITLAAGCSDTSGGGGGGGGQSNEDFEIRAMIASDRQQMQVMDERLRRLEGEIQDLVHNSPQVPVPAEGNVSAPPPPQAPPSAGAPPAPMGAPPPGAEAEPPPSMNAALPPNAGNTGGEATPPDAPAAEAGESAPPEKSTIAPEPGGNPPDEGAAEAPPPAAAGAAEGSDDENGSNAPGADNGNPPAPAPSPAAAGDEGEEGAAPPAGGEEVASAPPGSTTENAPAALPPARWPQDLARELQSSSNFKGGAGRLFHSGLDAMQNHNYAAAVETFAMLQKKFPRSDLGEPSSYFSASALNEMGKYDQAILQYNDVVMRFPKGKYASEALLRESQAFVQINDKVDARLTLQKLISEHPGTPQAAAATQMMKSLDSD